MEPRHKIISEVLIERTDQSDKYSNTHDDQHTRNRDWDLVISRYLEGSRVIDNREGRKRFVEVAAMSIAAIESYDRLYGGRK